MAFASNIKKRRIEKGMTQLDLSERLHVSRASISNWENEKNYPDFSLLISISNILDISLDTLIKDDYEMIEYIEKREKRTISQKKILLVVIPLCIILLFWFAINILNINVVEIEKSEINSTTVKNNVLSIDVKLNGFESIESWTLGGNDNIIDISISKTISLKNVFKKNKKSLIEIPLHSDPNVKEIKLSNSDEVIYPE